jgi:hypothetical protein
MRQPSTHLTIPLLLALAATMSLCAAGTGCGRAPPGTLFDFPTDAPELALASFDPLSGVWESAPWTGASWLPFPGQVQVRVAHSLGRIPRVVMVYLTFREVPLGGDLDAPPALAAGDLARVIEVTDTTITVWNDTNGDYFARVVAY